MVESRRASIFLWLGILGVVVLAGSSVALAQETQLEGKIRAGGEVVVSAGETVTGDLYASGGQVRIDGTVDGDLVASGGQVQVSGEVTGDMLVGSGNIDISGQVGGDARLGAGQVTLSGSVGEDLVVGAGQASVTSSGQVGEDFIFGTGRTTLDGEVAGDVLGSTGSYVRRGTVGGTEDVTISREEQPTVGERILDALQRFVALLAVGALLLWLFPRTVDGAARTLRRRFWTSLGLGLVGLVGSIVLAFVVLLVAILLAVGLGLIGLEDLVGLTIFTTAGVLTVLGLVLYVVVGFVAHAIVGLLIGRLLIRSEGAAQRWAALAVGILVVVVISSIPVVGGWFGFLIAMLGLGALILEFWPRRRQVPPPPA